MNLGCIDLNPHPVRAIDLDHPDELRIDLDPMPGVAWEQILEVAAAAREVLEEHGLTRWPKTSGSRGFHIYARLERAWTFREVRRAAVAVAREVERREPAIATSKWWKEERHGVFLDYNQNAKDRTIASAYSVRPTPDARVSAPLTWDEVRGVRPRRRSRSRRCPSGSHRAAIPWAGMDDAAGSLEPRCSSSQSATTRPGSAMPPGRRTTRRRTTSRRACSRRNAARGRDGDVPPPAPGKASGPTGRRRTTAPLVEIARAATQQEALDGLERWKARHPEVVPHLEPADVMVDAMRGRSTTWTRIRVNLRNVPLEDRPAQEPLEVDYDPWEGLRERWEGTQRDG